MRLQKQNTITYIRQHVRFGLALVFVVSVISTPVRASFEEYFLQVTCNQDLRYFSIKSFSLSDTDALSYEKAQETGIYSLRQLASNPVTCKFKHREVTVEVNSHRKPQPTGMCGGTESANFLVKYDGVEVGYINSGGGCKGQNYKSEMILSPFKQENCTIFFDGEEPRSECKPVKIPYWFENTEWYKRQKANKEKK